MIPRIWKRKWKDNDDSGQSDDDIYNEGTPNGSIIQDPVIVDDEINQNIQKQYLFFYSYSFFLQYLEEKTKGSVDN